MEERSIRRQLEELINKADAEQLRKTEELLREYAGESYASTPECQR